MPVGRDGDQLVPGAAPEFQYAPALPVGAGPVEVDCGPAAREHQVVQPRVRVERFTHEAPPPFRLMLGLLTDQRCSAAWDRDWMAWASMGRDDVGCVAAF